MNDILAIKEPGFEVKHTQMWVENAPARKKEEAAFINVDTTLTKLNTDARKAAWERDRMKLARDVAQLGKLYKATVESERAVRLEKVLHLKHQNTIGASLVSSYMAQNVQHRSGKQGELEVAVDKDWTVNLLLAFH